MLRWLIQLAALWLWMLASRPAFGQAENALLNQVVPAGGSMWRNAEVAPLQPGAQLLARDLLRTDPVTWAELLYLPACRAWLSPNSRALVAAMAPDASTGRILLKLMAGAVRVTLLRLGVTPPDFVVDADSVIAAARGTDFVVNRERTGEVQIIVFEGVVEVRRPGELPVLVQAGQMVRASDRDGLQAVTGLGERFSEVERQYSPLLGQSMGLAPLGGPLGDLRSRKAGELDRPADRQQNDGIWETSTTTAPFFLPSVDQPRWRIELPPP